MAEEGRKFRATCEGGRHTAALGLAARATAAETQTHPPQSGRGLGGCGLDGRGQEAVRAPYWGGDCDLAPGSSAAEWPGGSAEGRGVASHSGPCTAETDQCRGEGRSG